MTTANRILVVDDEEGLRLSLAASLELEGYEVAEAADGVQALERLREGAFDVVITDVRMPRLNGIDAFREMRKLHPETPVVLMTGFTAETLVEEVLGEGVYTVVHKPFEMQRMVDLISRAVERHMILVVDDDADQVEAIVEALRTVGLRAAAAHDGPAAVGLVKNEKVDVCVLDLVMPGMDGAETFAEIRRLDPSVIVVAIAGDTTPAAMHRIIRMGSYACLRKPFDVQELVRAIARARGRAVGR